MGLDSDIPNIELKNNTGDFYNYDMQLSLLELKHVFAGLVQVYPESKDALHIYFLNRFTHFNIADSLIKTSSDLLTLFEKGYLNGPEKNYSEISNKYDELKQFFDNSKEELDYFNKSIYDFLIKNNVGAQTKQVQQQSRSHQKNQKNVVYFNESVINKLYDELASPVAIKRLDEKNWTLFEKVLNLTPKEQAMPFFEKSNYIQKIGKRKYNINNFMELFLPFYHQFLVCEKFDVDYLREPLGFFKEQYHDEWTNRKINKYFK